MSDLDELASEECTLTVPSEDDGSLGDETFYDRWCGDIFLQWGLQHNHGYTLGEGCFMVNVDFVGIERGTLLRYRLEVERQLHEVEARRREDEEKRLARACGTCRRNWKSLKCPMGLCWTCCRKRGNTCSMHLRLAERGH
jgi:hypothetical protein